MKMQTCFSLTKKKAQQKKKCIYIFFTITKLMERCGLESLRRQPFPFICLRFTKKTEKERLSAPVSDRATARLLGP